MGDLKVVSAVEQFSGTMNFWRKEVYPMLIRLIAAIRSKNKEEVTTVYNLLKAALVDENLNGEKFYWSQQIIEGMEEKCMKGTVFDIGDKRSMIYLHYNRLSLIVHVSYLLVHDKSTFFYKPRWKNLGYGLMTLENCANLIEEGMDDVFKKDGIFDKMRERAKQGKHKI